jgi:hypothetical protein
LRAAARCVLLRAACCALRAACCVLRAACCVLRAACCANPNPDPNFAVACPSSITPTLCMAQSVDLMSKEETDELVCDGTAGLVMAMRSLGTFLGEDLLMAPFFAAFTSATPSCEEQTETPASPPRLLTTRYFRRRIDRSPVCIGTGRNQMGHLRSQLLAISEPLVSGGARLPALSDLTSDVARLVSEVILGIPTPFFTPGAAEEASTAHIAYGLRSAAASSSSASPGHSLTGAQRRGVFRILRGTPAVSKCGMGPANTGSIPMRQTHCTRRRLRCSKKRAA